MILGVSLDCSPWHLILLVDVFYIRTSPVVSGEQLSELLCISRTLCLVLYLSSIPFLLISLEFLW
jgi:hypothetical protein